MRISFPTVIVVSLGLAAGCAQNWPYNPLKTKLPALPSFSAKSAPATENLQVRAAQLETIGEYEAAEELYAEILKQDPRNELAEEKLASIQFLKKGQRTPRTKTNSLPVVSPGENRTEKESSRPAFTPEEPRPRSPFDSRKPIANQSPVPQSKSFPLAALENPESLPAWARDTPVKARPVAVAKTRQPQSVQKQRVPVYILPHLRETESAKEGARSVRVISNAGGPEVLAPTVEKTPSSVHVDWSTQSLANLQQQLINSPDDVHALRELIGRMSSADRETRWKAASSLEVLASHPVTRSLVMSELSKQLAEENPRNREAAALSLAGFRQDARATLPLLRLRTQDDDPRVRQAAGIAIEAIGQ